QTEAGIHFIEPLLLDLFVNGRAAGPVGHDSPTACPHGVYATQGTERYIALAVETAEQWRALRALAPLEAFAADAYDTPAVRRKHRAEIDEALRRWCADQEPFELAARLKAAGVPASVALRPSDLYADAQLAHRRFFVTLDHAVMGPTPYDGLATIFSATPGTPRFAAPALGQHTEQVLREILGVGDEEVTEYVVAGALT